MKLNRTLIAGLIALAALTGSAISLAGPANEIETTYFSDATHHTVIGEVALYCTGRHTSWGTTSIYKETTSYPCE